MALPTRNPEISQIEFRDPVRNVLILYPDKISIYSLKLNPFLSVFNE
jgi:hypothetical protein